MENENKFPRTRVFVLAALLLILLTFLLQYVIWHNSAPLASILLNTAQTSGVLTLGELQDFEADMLTTVFVGNRETCLHGDAMVTPRGYGKRQ